MILLLLISMLFGNPTNQLASLIEAECGICNTKEKELVGSTVLNRMENKEFPSSMREVLNQPGQYTQRRPKPSQESLQIARKLLYMERQYKQVLYFCKKGIKLRMKVLYVGKYHKYGI